LLRSIRRAFPWLSHIFADSAYAGDKLKDKLARMGDWVIDIVKRSDEDAAKGFVLLPRRWVVERPIGVSTIACAHMCSAPCGPGAGAFGSTLNLRSSVQCCAILGFYRRTRPRILLSRSIALMPPSSSRGAGSIGATAEHLIWNAIAMQD
jgi:transposase